jgi:preprotein translocase subunit SecA
MNILKKIFGSKNDREIRRIRSVVEKINALEEGVRKLPDEAFPAKTEEFKQRVARGEALESILPEAFAVIREAARRVRNERHFDVQLIGGIVLHEGKIAEMRTGEGKTLTATAPVYLNALSGKGVHVVTVNDYLATRDAETMGKVYAFCGLTTGIIVHGLSDEQRRTSYSCDITYGTNNEFGFDFLRDNMKTEMARTVQRGHNFAIVDEVDSILIDEARTPLIISGPTESNLSLFVTVNAAIPGLQKDSDYIVDEKARAVMLTEDGISKLEKRLRVDNLYDPGNIDFLHHVQQALKAHVTFKKDVDYVVRDGKVIIVDEFTGRLMPGRRYSDGLHGALEAKEHVPVQSETQTMATITFQNYFRLYKKMGGMTGTADTESVEFKKIYNLDVVVIPTNRPMVRSDYQDVIFRTAREKFNAIADDIAEAQKKGQPVLVGTVSVEKSELLSGLLKKRGIPHEILNAKNHAREAEIIKNAGQRGMVTISTNMAGRGTDIVLGPEVANLGGLYVVGTERHESRRIDNQLRGRSGRQGDAGASRFYLSLEDDLMRIFAADWLQGMMSRLGMKEGEAIESPLVTRSVERAQKRVEDHNFSSRKHLLEYDDVMNQQRQVVYRLRRQMLEGLETGKQDEIEFLESAVSNLVAGTVERQIQNAQGHDNTALRQAMTTAMAQEHNARGVSLPESFEKEGEGLEVLIGDLTKQVIQTYRRKFDEVGAEIKSKIESFIYLQVIDRAWKNHLLGMDALKDSVSLRGYGQRDPLQEYKREAFRLFEAMMVRIEDETTQALLHLERPRLEVASELHREEASEDELEFKHPEASHFEDEPASPTTPGIPGIDRRGVTERFGDETMVYHGPRTAVEESAERRQISPAPVKRAAPKVGRNDPCPCGSGKKFKKCHGHSGTEALSVDSQV